MSHQLSHRLIIGPSSPCCPVVVPFFLLASLLRLISTMEAPPISNEPECGADAELELHDESKIWLHSRPHTPSRPDRCEKRRKIWYCGLCWIRNRRDIHYRLYNGTYAVFKHLRNHGVYLQSKNPKHTDSTQKKLTDSELWSNRSSIKPRKPQS